MSARSAEGVSIRRLRSRLLLFLVTALLVGILLAIAQFVGTAGLGGFLFAWIAHFGLMAWVVLVAEAFPLSRIRFLFRIRPGEVRLHRVLGAPQFLRLLDRIGWNRLVGADSFDGTRAGLRKLALRTRRSESAHVMILLIALVLMVAVTVTGSPSGVVWLAVLAVPLHVLPILGQRFIRSRVQVLEGRLGPG